MKEHLLELGQIGRGKYGRYVRYAPLVGYPLFYVLCLLLFAAACFPYDKLKERILGSFDEQERATGGTRELQIDEMHGYWLSGVRVKGVRLLTAPSEPGKPLSKIEVDEATVRYQLLPALVGDTDLKFDVYAFGGEVSGSYDVGSKSRAVDLTLDAVDLGEVEPLGELLGVPIQGRMSGTVRLDMPEGKMSKASGAISLDTNAVSVGDGKAKIKGALALPKLDVGAVAFAGEAKDGVLKITKLSAGGKDVELKGEGRVSMREPATDSLVDAQVRFKINDAYRNKSDITKSLFGAPGSNAPALFELADPRVKQAKRADGFYAWALRGAVGRLDFMPAAGPMGGAMPAAMPSLGSPRVMP